MFDFDRWQSVNEAYLSTSLDWLRSRLQQLADVANPSTEPKALASNPAASVVSLNGLNAEYQPALEVLAARFGLSEFEKQVVLLCAAMEFDPRIPGSCAAAQGDSMKIYPTAALCFSLFEQAAWDLLSPERPLRRYRLIEIDRHPHVPLTTSPLRIDERIVSYLKGLNFVDERLALFLSPLELPDNLTLPPSQRAHVERVLDAYQQEDAPAAHFPIVQLLGPNSEDKQRIAAELARRLGIRIYRLPADLIPQQIGELDTFARLWQRECQLVPVGLYIEMSESGEKPIEQTVARLLHRLTGIVLIDAHDQQPGCGGRSLLVDVATPTADEQLVAWCDRLPNEAVDAAQQLVGQFDMNLSAIDRVAATLHDATLHDAVAIRQHLWNGCRQHTRPKLEELAQRIDVKATWDDLVLPADELNLLRQVSAQVRHRGKVLDEWGFRGKVNRGLGVTALFAGESGTGKTMAAEVIANDLQLDLYRIDLSSVINKYIGETEKNLRRLFDTAERGGAILFFDEADALFGKRSEVKDSHDRFANIEVNYLLQRMESYRGLAILATNNKSALDDAFTRRLRFIIDFRFPDAVQRKQIWHRIFPAQTPLTAIDYNHLAKLRFTGGHIYNIALTAAFTAASDRPSVDMPSILNAARGELVKAQKPLNVGDFQWIGPQEVES